MNREVKIPAIYKHFKHTEDGIPNNYMYATIGIAETIDVVNLPIEKINEGHGFWVIETESLNKIHVVLGKDNKFYILQGQKNCSLHDISNGKYVIYSSLYNSGTYARPLDMFLEEVPEGKENPIDQKYRFELVKY